MSKRRASLSDRPVATAPTPRTTDDVVLGKERARQEVEEIPLRAIMPNHLQPRTQPNPEGLRELADSIQQHGVLEPIIVRAITLTEYEGAGRRYELVAGERRWRASALAERDTIPAIVVSNATDDRAMLELAITENLQREDLHPLDEAMAFGRMQTELGYSYAQIADRLGKSKGYVQNRMRLLQLEEDLQLLVAERPDTLKHVSEIAKVSDSIARTELITAVRDDALSFAATQARVHALLQPAPSAPPTVDEPYSREYDRDESLKDQQRDVSRESGESGKSYSREYDRDKHHEKDRPVAEAIARQATTTDTSSLLTARERTVLTSVTEKVERLRDNVSQLTAEDWEILSPLALRLSDLLRQVGQAQALRRD